MKAWELLEQKGWCQGVSKDKQGRYCVLGAIGRAYYLAPPSEEIKAENRLRALLGIGNTISGWNDHPGRTKEEVIAKLKEADV